MKTAMRFGSWLLVAGSVGGAGCGGAEIQEAALAPSPATSAPETTAAPATSTGSAEIAAPSSGRPPCWPSGIVGRGACVTCPAPHVPGAVQPLRARPATGPTNVSAAAQSATRRAPFSLPTRNLLTTKIQQLEAIVQSMPLGDSQRGETLRRLARAYVDLEVFAVTAKRQAEADRDAAHRAGNATAEATAEASRVSAEGAEQTSRQGAIKSYTMVTEDYAGVPSPRFTGAATPAALADIDESFYSLAAEYELAGDGDHARKTYVELIKRYPSSVYVPNAYLAFAEFFFNEAQSDPAKWPLARQAYEKVVAVPPPANKLYGYAWYKLAYLEWNTGDLRAALSGFAKVVTYGSEYPQLPGASRLLEAAKKDLVTVYALAGVAQSAYGFFEHVMGDAPEALRMTAAAAEAFNDTGRYAEAIVVYRDLLARSKEDDERRCVYHNRAKELSYQLGRRDECPDCVP